MTKAELYEYIKNRKYYCICCYDLQQEIIKNGIDILPNDQGMICGGVMDMIYKYNNIDIPEVDPGEIVWEDQKK